MSEIKESVELYTKTLGELFEIDKKENAIIGKLTIPDYQRAYEWNKYHVKNLLVDTYESYQKQTEYLMGTIIVHNNGDTLDLVDGQQRLITLSILLNELKSRNTPLLDASFDNEKSIFYIKNTQREVQSFLQSKKNDGYVTFLINKLKFYVLSINSGSLDLAYTFFDGINSKGKTLSDFDLLKAHHLMFIPEEQESLARKHNDFWQGKDRHHSEMFGSLLRRIRMWSRGQERDNKADRNDFYEFISTVEPSELELSEHQFNRYMQPNVFKSWHRENDTVVLNMKYGQTDMESAIPFEIPQTIEGGDSFFLYAKRYHAVFELLFLDTKGNRSSALQYVNDLSKNISNDYLKTAFQAVMMLYFDKFGEYKIIEISTCVELIISECRFFWGISRPSPIRIETMLSMVKDKNLIPVLLNSTIASHVEKLLSDSVVVSYRDERGRDNKDSNTLSTYKSNVVRFYNVNKSKIKNKSILEKVEAIYYNPKQ